MQISCVIVTKNEERNIARCLESVIGVTDEIIVIDSFSTDRTEEICKTYPIRFLQCEWKGYAETKNYGNSLTSFEYILSIDADEALSENLQKEIIAIKSKGNICDGYMLKRLTNYCGKWIRHCGWYPDAKLRLWKKNKGEWEGLIHEEIKLQKGSDIWFLKADLYHFSYYSINEHLQQMVIFTDLMARNNFEKGKKAGIFKLVFSPFFKFIKSYFIHAGFLDGFYGFVICILSSLATFLKYAKTQQIYWQNRGL